MGKTYIIFNNYITYLGGSQQYLSNKVKYLKRNNYKVFVFSASKGPIFISELKPYKELCIEKLRYRPYYYSNNAINKIINRMLEKIDILDEIIIESTSLSMALWGEMLAMHLNCKHIVYDLSEEKLCHSEYIRKFVYFKYRRNEIAMIVPKFFSYFLNNYNEESAMSRVLNAKISNTVEDCEFDADSIPKREKIDYLIGCIGRFNKSSTMYAVKGVCQFALSHRDKKIALVLIGGGSKKCEKKIRQIVKFHKNIKLILMGYVHPIPLKLIQKFDVFVSASGSARITANENIPTITVSHIYEQPIGILYYTTLLSVSTEYQNDGKSIKDYLDMILIDKYCETHTKIKDIGHNGNYNYDSLYDDHMEFIEKSSPVREYYNFCCKTFTIKEKIVKFSLKVLPFCVVKLLEIMYSKYNNIFQQSNS